MPNYIFVTGGVVSSLGKGIAAASLGRLLQSRGLKVTLLKCDPYLNVDPGTMNPYQHGEVFVTKDGAETDLDLGHYERFLDTEMQRANNLTAGQVYAEVIARERRGEFLGATVQVIPHITDVILARFRQVVQGQDMVIVEIGGTVGDIESLPFLEAARQMRLKVGRENVVYIHVTLIPYLKASEELKTKPTQHSVNKLREIGIDPDIILCRTERSLSEELKAKIALFCSVPLEAVVEVPDVGLIYEVPLLFEQQGLDEQCLMLLKRRSAKKDLEGWRQMVHQMKHPQEEVRVAVAGKYTEFKDAYKSIVEALLHAGFSHRCRVLVDYLDTSSDKVEAHLTQAHGVLVPGGFGDRGIEGKIRVTRWAREHQVPFFGLCLGMQCAVIEVARNLLGLSRAHSSEFAPRTPHAVIDLLPEQQNVQNKGATMRLGHYPCRIQKNSSAWKAYRTTQVRERHRHRYELNPHYRRRLEKVGLRVTGEYPPKKLSEIVEFSPHPWFLAVQFHPEFQSRPIRPHPLFRDFIAAALSFRRSRWSAGTPASTVSQTGARSSAEGASTRGPSGAPAGTRSSAEGAAS
ncbi:MAG: CTP synthase [Elusimicrobia bacterium]|nr:CTP synthase [Elusimicrobiota bacterium]